MTTIAEINQNIVAQLEASFGETIPLLPKSFIRVLSKVLAAVYVTLFKYGGWSTLQLFVRTASDQETTINGRQVTPLFFWGELVGAGSPAEAIQAELTIDVTVTQQTGTLVSGSQLVSSQNGVTYVVTGDVPLNAPVVQAVIRAAGDEAGTAGAGTAGNLEDGAVVSFANPLANVSRDAVVVNTITAGADAETTEAYRQRVLDRFQKRPQGGAASDYEIWAEEPVEILNAYPYTSAFPGQVDVYIEVVATVGNPDGIPTPAQLQTALDSINFDDNGLASRAPVGALPNTFAITRTDFDVVVTDLNVSDPATVEAGVDQAVKEYFLAAEPFIIGLSPSPRRDRITSAAVAAVVNDIISAANGTYTSISLFEGGSPIVSYTLGIGEKAKGNDVQFI